MENSYQINWLFRRVYKYWTNCEGQYKRAHRTTEVSCQKNSSGFKFGPVNEQRVDSHQIQSFLNNGKHFLHQLSGMWGLLFTFSMTERSSGAMAMFGKVLEPVGYMQTVR